MKKIKRIEEKKRVRKRVKRLDKIQFDSKIRKKEWER